LGVLVAGCSSTTFGLNAVFAGSAALNLPPDFSCFTASRRFISVTSPAPQDAA